MVSETLEFHLSGPGSNPGLLVETRKRDLCAMQPPVIKMFKTLNARGQLNDEREGCKIGIFLLWSQSCSSV